LQDGAWRFCDRTARRRPRQKATEEAEAKAKEEAEARAEAEAAAKAKEEASAKAKEEAVAQAKEEAEARAKEEAEAKAKAAAVAKAMEEAAAEAKEKAKEVAAAKMGAVERLCKGAAAQLQASRRQSSRKPGLPVGGGCLAEPPAEGKGMKGKGKKREPVPPTKEELVASIKAYQRQGTFENELWHNHCDKVLHGARDPSRHDVNTLWDFIRTHVIDPGSERGPRRGRGYQG